MRGGRVAEGGHDFPEEEERLLHRNRETLMHRNRGALPSFIAGIFAQKSREVRPTFIAPYGLHLFHSTEIDVLKSVRPALNAVRTALIIQHRNRGTACSTAALNSCTVFEVRTAFIWHCFRGRCTACWSCTFAFDFAQKKKMGVGWFAEH